MKYNEEPEIWRWLRSKQAYNTGQGSFKTATHAKGGGQGYEDETITLTDRFTTAPTTTRMELIDTTISSLKDGGFFDKLDVLCLIGADAQASCQNWIKNGINAVLYNSPDFVADRYFGGDAISKYIDTNFNPSTAGQYFALNDATQGLIYYAKETSGGYNGISASILARGSDGTGWCNQAPSANLQVGSLNPGHGTWVRVNANSSIGYKNGVQIDTSSDASTSLANSIYNILRYGASYNNAEISGWYMGKALSGPEVTALNTIIKTYLDGIGCTIL